MLPRQVNALRVSYVDQSENYSIVDALQVLRGGREETQGNGAEGTHLLPNFSIVAFVWPECDRCLYMTNGSSRKSCESRKEKRKKGGRVVTGRLFVETIQIDVHHRPSHKKERTTSEPSLA